MQFAFDGMASMSRDAQHSSLKISRYSADTANDAIRDRCYRVPASRQFIVYEIMTSRCHLRLYVFRGNRRKLREKGNSLVSRFSRGDAHNLRINNLAARRRCYFLPARINFSRPEIRASRPAEDEGDAGWISRSTLGSPKCC